MANRIKELRKKHKITLQQLSKETGISISSLSAYEKSEGEKGYRYPKMDKLTKLADFFGVTVDYLTGKTDVNTYEQFTNASLKAFDAFKHAGKHTNELVEHFSYPMERHLGGAINYFALNLASFTPPRDWNSDVYDTEAIKKYCKEIKYSMEKMQIYIRIRSNQINNSSSKNKQSSKQLQLYEQLANDLKQANDILSKNGEISIKKHMSSEQ